MRFILNIGLDVNATRLLAAHVVKQLVVAADFVINADRLVESDTEPTLVLDVTSLSGPSLTLAQLRALATDLEQDCIAVYRPKTGNGALVGPRADKWGPFNPQYFFNLDGTRLVKETATA
jgi:hypothetical protein